MFLNSIHVSNLNFNGSNLSDLRNLQEQVKKAFCYQKLFWPFTVWINCSSDLKNFANSRPSASNFKSFSRSLEQFFLTVGQNNFGNKIPFPSFFLHFLSLFPINYVFDIWNPDMRTSITLEKYKVNLDRFSYVLDQSLKALHTFIFTLLFLHFLSLFPINYVFDVWNEIQFSFDGSMCYSTIVDNLCNHISIDAIK